jgi:hypothetical protein
MKDLVFKSPVWGFSRSHVLGASSLMISRVLSTMLSASSRFRGVFALVLARE